MECLHEHRWHTDKNDGDDGNGGAYDEKKETQERLVISIHIITIIITVIVRE